MSGAVKEKRTRWRPGSVWRLLSWTPKGTRYEYTSSATGALFDELVVDGWLHVEQMGRDQWWLRVADRTIWVRVGKDGSAKITSEERRGA